MTDARRTKRRSKKNLGEEMSNPTQNIHMGQKEGAIGDAVSGTKLQGTQDLVNL